MTGAQSRPKRRVKRVEVEKPQRAIAPLTADEEFEKSKADARLSYFHGVERDLRNTRTMLQEARAEITLLRKTLAELHAHAERPWWVRMFNSRQWWT